MNAHQFFRIVFRRALIASLLSAALIWLGSEMFYRVQAESDDRGPRQVELVIPEGTADNIAKGEAVPAIPEGMVFVTGDLLVVRNRDVVDHQLGPLWIPAKSSAILALDEEQNKKASCSFQPSKTFGLDVRKATTWETRLQALLLAGPATAIFVTLYSFLVFPIKSTGSQSKSGAQFTRQIGEKADKEGQP